ncbi:DUF6934 family protein [Dyadobacter sp.]|uniref:DUF6934 family protein n=1 Tax=Dyadobacter sp. TaxID=1914288 RepID=UPI003F72FAB1
MKLPKYPIHQLDEFTYQFLSRGPRGDFEMRVLFTQEFAELPTNIYHLAFGCWSYDLQDIDDVVELRNKDADKVLATVTHIALHFLRQHSSAFIFAQGSTPSRTRKYQMGVAKNLKEMPFNIKVKGLVPGTASEPEPRWADFRIGINYKAFILYARV